MSLKFAISNALRTYTYPSTIVKMAMNNTPLNTEAIDTASSLAATMIEPQTPQAHTDTSTPTKLLDLPAELRNRIYEFALPSSFNLQKLRRFMDYWDGDLPGLLQVSQQIRAEVMGIWLADTMFTFQTHRGLRRFLRVTGEQNSGRLKQVRYTQMSWSLDAALKELWEMEESFVGLGLRQGILEARYPDDQVVIIDGIEDIAFEDGWARTPTV